LTIFDQEAINYDKWYETRIGQHADQVETDCAFHLFQIEPGMRILDVGCGTGNFSVKLARKGASITGIDISEQMLAIARKRALKEKVNIQFKLMDSQNIQFPDHFFDGVLSMATIEFIPDPQKMIAEMFRVCKKGGPILVGTINRASDWGQLYQDPEFQKNVPVFKHADFKSPADLVKFRKDALINVKECLFIAPDTPDSEISQEKEEELSSMNHGGFFCILWQKK
jgi:ubiquinone biosynthesis O-methyltransferase